MTKVIGRQKYYFPLKTSSFSTNHLILRVDQDTHLASLGTGGCFHVTFKVLLEARVKIHLATFSLFLLFVTANLGFSQTDETGKARGAVVDRVETSGFIQVEGERFTAIPSQQT